LRQSGGVTVARVAALSWAQAAMTAQVHHQRGMYGRRLSPRDRGRGYSAHPAPLQGCRNRQASRGELQAAHHRRALARVPACATSASRVGRSRGWCV